MLLLDSRLRGNDLVCDPRGLKESRGSHTVSTSWRGSSLVASLGDAMRTSKDLSLRRTPMDQVLRGLPSGDLSLALVGKLFPHFVSGRLSLESRRADPLRQATVRVHASGVPVAVEVHGILLDCKFRCDCFVSRLEPDVLGAAYIAAGGRRRGAWHLC